MNEIRVSRAFQLYGACLAFTHLLSFYAWHIHDDFVVRTLTRDFPVCWPFFEDCHALRPMPESLVSMFLWAYGAVALASLVLFIANRSKFTVAATVLLGLSLVLKVFVSVQDYRFMGNFHYMAYFAHLVFLFTPDKKRALPLLLVSFYVAAGLIKFTPEWLEGQTLLQHTFLKGPWLKAACVYVIILEIALAPFLLSSRPTLRWLVLAQLIVFHIFSWHIVGYLYPLMMLALLAFFPLQWCLDRKASGGIIPPRFVSYLVLGVFWTAQSGPLWFRGDSRITSEGRIFSLNMLDAKTECRELLVLRARGQTLDLSDHNLDLGHRIGCDPLVHLQWAQHHCRARGSLDGFEGIDIRFESRLRPENAFTPLIRIDDICNKTLSFSLFRKNEWLHEASLGTPDIVRNNDKATSLTTLPAHYAVGPGNWVYALDTQDQIL